MESYHAIQVPLVSHSIRRGQDSYRAWFDEIKGPDFVGSGLTTSNAIIAKLNPPNSNQYAQTVNTDYGDVGKTRKCSCPRWNY